MVEKKLFWGQTLEMEILTDLRVLKSPESENHIFRVSFIISITQKQITEETSDLVFYICIMYRCYLKFFIKIGQIFCIQRYTQKFENITA